MLVTAAMAAAAAHAQAGPIAALTAAQESGAADASRTHLHLSQLPSTQEHP